jgi:Uma2 family endonuclease
MGVIGTSTRRTPPGSPEVPSLEQGDHLTREEFERRYDAMPEVNKAELIEGVVHMPSPVRWKKHAGPHLDMITWLGVYKANTPGTDAGDRGTIRLDLENEPQPDAALIVEPAYGGRVQLSADDYIEGAPDLVAEVAASSVSIDLNAKLRVYLRNSVREYIVWRAQDQTVDWFVLRRSQYDRNSLSADGLYKSVAFPGLWLDPNALEQGDLAHVLRVLQKGVDSPEHQDFVTQLARHKITSD